MKHWNARLKIGAIIVLFFLILGFIVPFFRPHEDVMAWSVYGKNLKPSWEHPLGTTSMGQDVFWLLACSIQNSLIIGICTAAIATVVGVAVGLFSGLKGGWADRVCTLIMDSLIAIPSLPILILLGSILKGRTPWVLISLVLALFSWPWPARQTRAMALSMRENDFISTAIFSGESTRKIISREIFPFVSDWSAANFVNTILSAIGSESGLALIGMSNNSTATLGTMIYWANSRQALIAERYWWILPPVIAVVLLFVGLFILLSGYQTYHAHRRGK